MVPSSKLRGHLVSALTVIAGFGSHAFADPTPYDSAWHGSIQTDVGDPIIFQGLQIGLGIRPSGPGRIHHFQFRASFVHQVIPSFFVDFDSKNEGWGQTVNLGVLIVDYFFRDGGRGGFHLTPGAAFASGELTPPDGSSPAHESRLNLAAGAAYQWFPFAHNGFFVEPWFFLIISPLRLGGSATTMSGQTFHDPVVIPALALQLGYEL